MLAEAVVDDPQVRRIETPVCVRDLPDDGDDPELPLVAGLVDPGVGPRQRGRRSRR